MSFGWGERALLLAVVAASCYAFATRFAAVLGTIRTARPDPDFALRPLAPRLRALVAEVLLQGKVIRERPWPGLAHALLFWGFCLFAPVSFDHLLAAFGADFLADSAAGRIYLHVAAALAAAVAVSITGLAVRRFLLRPRWLGEVSPESGLIAALIFVLMATYLGSFALASDTPAARANWWVHTLAWLAFLPAIPRTKHLHLVLSPFSVFLRRPGFSAIAPLAGDEDFGLASGRDLTWVGVLQVSSCVECGRCSEHCPAFNTGKQLDPKQIVLGLRHYLQRRGPASSHPLLEADLSMQAVFQCTTCGACEYQCPTGIQHLPLLIGLRRGVVNTGRWRDAYGTRLFLNLERTGNALGLPLAERTRFLEQRRLPVFDGTQEYCLWLGCMGSYDPEGRRILLALVSVLHRLGVGFGVLPHERCNGEPARRLGNDLLFAELAQVNLAELDRVGARRILSICPHCVRTMSEDWREFGAELEILHHSELLARLAARIPQSRNPPLRLAYHDGCYLGRYRGLYEAPRAILRRSGELIEPLRTRGRSFCCGAGGGLYFLGEEQGRRVSAERSRELIATGAEIVAAACPFCRSMLADAFKAAGPQAPGLADLAEIAASALGPGT